LGSPRRLTRSCFHPRVSRLLSTRRSLGICDDLELILSRVRLFRVPSPRLLAPRSFDPSFTLPRFLALFATSPERSPFFAGAPTPPLRSVLRFSQPLDGFLRAPARRPLSSRCHVQGLSRSGASPPAQPPFLFGRSLPPGRWTHSHSPAYAGSPRDSALDFEAFICAGPRSLRRRYSPRRASLPSSGSSPPGSSPPTAGRSLPTTSALDVSPLHLRSRARAPASSSASSPQEARRQRLRSARLLEISSLPSGAPCSTSSPHGCPRDAFAVRS